ncbi:MAG: glycoside hydrolase family 3 C-terminal domain-containing protein [Atopobiaceae bacterium]
MGKKSPERKLLTRRGFVATGALGLAAAAGIGSTVEQYSSTLDQNLGTKSSEFVSQSTSDQPLYEAYQPSQELLMSDGSGSSHALIEKAIDLGRRQAAGGAVLLKNNTESGSGLPLAAGEKVTLFGIRSHVTLLGSGMGTKVTGPYISLEQALADTSSTDFANTIATGTSMKTIPQDDGSKKIVFSDPAPTISGWTGDEFEIEGAGLEVNPTMVAAYDAINQELKHTNNDIPANVFDPGEPSTDQLEAAQPGYRDSFASYSDAAIVVLGRPSAESVDYFPGGVAEGTGASEPLALCDNERAAIEMAKQCSKNVIVILNSASTMEIRELADDEEIAAIISMGYPGAYGLLGIADIIVGRENPSGHLADIMPTYNMSAPAMQNMGNYSYANASEVLSRGAGMFGDTSSHYVIEAEGIYTGYRYYETRYFDCVLGQGNAANPSGAYARSDKWDYASEVTYGFGYGLSYTTFSQTLSGTPKLSVTKNDKGATEVYLTVKVDVANSGNVAGRSVVQVYGQAPYKQSGTEKPAILLLGFGKTATLQPGSSETVEVVVDLQNLASYDMTHKNADGTQGSYVFEAGSYWFAIGNGAHDALNSILAASGADQSAIEGEADASKAYRLDVTESVIPESAFALSKTGVQVSNQLEYSDWNHFQAGEVTALSRTDWGGTYPTTYSDMTLRDEELINYLSGNYYEVHESDDTSSILWNQSSDVMFHDLAGLDYDDATWDEALNKMSLEEALNVATFGGPSIPGISSLGLYEATMTENMGIGFVTALSATVDTNAPWAIKADDKNAAWTGSVLGSAPLLASSFDHDLMYEEGGFVGNESLFFGIPILWGPGLNTHRHAYNGRNGEYYTEDPVLGGTIAMEYAVGASDFGLVVAPKHFAFNDQETNRSGVAPYMTEQKAREGDLRAFQIAFEAVKYRSQGEGRKLKGLMTSFSKIGPVECTCSSGLMTNILQKEWGAHGYFVTDIYDDADLYAAVLNSGVTCFDTRGYSGFNDDGSSIYSTQIFASQHNGIQAGVKTVEHDANLQSHVKDSVHNVLYALEQSNLVNRYNSTAKVEKRMTWWRGAYLGLAAASGIVAIGALASAAGIRKRNAKQKDAENSSATDEEA